MTEKSNQWREYLVTGEKEGKILLLTSWTADSILAEVVARGFLPPPFTQYKLNYAPDDGRNLEICNGNKTVKLVRTDKTYPSYGTLPEIFTFTCQNGHTFDGPENLLCIKISVANMPHLSYDTGSLCPVCFFADAKARYGNLTKTPIAK